MCFFWNGSPVTVAASNWGALAVIQPLLQQMDIAAIIDRHVPADPQVEFSFGKVLEILLAARLQNPVALMNVAAWASESGADAFYGIPADKLNDDRLGRCLDAFFTQRHSILGSVAAHVIRTFKLPTEHLHYDPTHILLQGAYERSQPIDTLLSLPPQTPSRDFPPAHITHGYLDKRKMIHVGTTALIDDLGAVPIYGHTLSGNRNGHTGVAQQCHLLQEHLTLPPFLMVSDRGTFSVEHVARLQRAGHGVLCSVSWADWRPFFEQHRAQLTWSQASFLSVEQQRRRACQSSLPQEHYRLAVVKHTLQDPDDGADIPCRVVFVFSSADQKAQRNNRAAACAKIRTGLEKIRQAVARAHATTKLDKIPARVAKLLGKKQAARYFRYELVPLSAAERRDLPPPQRGCRLPTHRFDISYDETLAEQDAQLDGYYALVTTAPLTYSADTLFSCFKRQSYLEAGHHQFKTPLAVTPVFLKTPQRVEALVGLLHIALTAYHLVQRLYRQAVADLNVPRAEKRLTTEGIFRIFNICPLHKESTAIGTVIHASTLTIRQQEVLSRLKFPTPVQSFAAHLPEHPPPR